MSDFFTLTPGKPPASPAAAPDEFARGDDWIIRLRGGSYLLEYWSGELADHLQTLALSQREADALRQGTTTVDEVLAARGAL